MTNNGYSGWMNYETWNVHLWLNNDQASEESWHDRARRTLAVAAKTKAPADTAEQEHEEAVSSLAEQLEHGFDQQVDDWLEGKPPCCFSDLLLASLREVNWREIAKHLLENVHVEA